MTTKVRICCFQKQYQINHFDFTTDKSLAHVHPNELKYNKLSLRLFSALIYVILWILTHR